MERRTKIIINLTILYILITIILTIINQIYKFTFSFIFFTEEIFVQSVVESLWINMANILFFTIFLAILLYKEENRSEINNYHNNIDDCRFWFAEEAAFKNGANIRRLFQKGIYSFDLSKSMLKGLKLKKSSFEKSKFMGACLDNCNISNSTFIECNFQGASFDSVNSKNATFKNCILKNSKLVKSKFQSSTFIDVNFEKSNFFNADFSYSKFINCNFSGANFEKLNLERADLRESIGISKKQLLSCNSLKYTKLENRLEKDIYEIQPDAIGFNLEHRNRFAGK